MGITRYTASADTTITSGYKPFTNTPAHYANMGAADSLEIYSIYHEATDQELSRVLLKFPIVQISSSLEASIIPQNSRFYLKLFNVEHPETLPKNYYVSVVPISSSWDEGYGLDLDNYKDIGQSGSSGFGANWMYKTKSDPELAWTQEGGDFIYDLASTFYFDTGTEDLEVDVTDIILAQVSGNIPPHGLAVMLSGSYEDGTNETTYYTKRFSARSTQYFYKRPTLEARWDNSIRDDRGNMFFASPNLSIEDNTQNIYFYNRVNGILTNVYDNPDINVKVLDESGVTVSDVVVAENVADGIYKAGIAFTGSVDQEMTDVWYSGSTAFYSGSISVSSKTFNNSINLENYVFAATNLKQKYKTYERPIIKIHVRQKNWSPNIYKIANSNLPSLKLNNLYYKITRIVDNLTIIDFGVDPVPYTKCSYNKDSNYFSLDMSLFEPGYTYYISLMLLVDGNMEETSEIFKFKVE